MPIYTYTCSACKNHEERLELFGKPSKKCPCGNPWKRNQSLTVNKLYRPDADKIYETMKVKHTYL